MNTLNIHPNKPKYFYTVLFLDNYFPKAKFPEKTAVTKIFDISADTNNSTVKWLTNKELLVRHNLCLPITLEMWNAKNEPIFYCPILKKDVKNYMVGNISIESETTLKFDFTDIETPVGIEVFKLAIRALPLFDLEKPYFPKFPLDECVDNQTGLAIVFRRNSLDALFDLIVEFDESYWHSLETTYDLQYLTDKSCYKDCYFTRKIYFRIAGSFRFN